MKQKETRRQRADVWWLGGRGVGEGWRGSLGLAGLHIIIYKDGKLKALLHITGSSSQKPVINHNRKEYEKKCICV